MPRNLYMVYFIIAILIVAVDQFTKFLVKNGMNVGDSISVLGDFFRLTYVRNTGAAFSLMSGQKFILLVVPIVAIIIAIVYMYRHKGQHWTLYCSLTLIIAGGIGNLIDRAILGYVTDMFDFSIFPPVFNVADISVTFGCALLIIFVLFGEKLGKNREK